MRPHVILRQLGFVLLLNAMFLAVSAAISGGYHDSAFFSLAYSAAVVFLFGLFPILFVPPVRDITTKEGFFIVVSGWLVSCLAGIVPYLLWGGEFTLANAWFESVSGFTTTGSTVLSDVEALPRGLLFWRSSTHWIGGVGIIVFALAVLPSMGKARMILFKAETSPMAVTNFRYRTQTVLKIIMVVYLGLTLFETLGLMACGMGLFDAVNHAFATIATGGFSTKDLSVAAVHSPAIETVIMVFMCLSGMNFMLLFAAMDRKRGAPWKSSVLTYYVAALAIGVVLTTISVHGSVYPGWGASLRYAAFQVLSLGTTTGFASADSSVWPQFAQLLLIFFTLQCACAGSTSGGIKVDRVLVFFSGLKARIFKMQHPSAVVAQRIDGMKIDEEMLETSLLYIILYMGIVLVSALLLTGLGMDMLSAFSGSAATMGNVGPGFGALGSLDNFGGVPDLGKWILSGNMLLGRLEIFGVVLFLLYRSWQ